MYKKRDGRAKLLLCRKSSPIPFCRSRSRCRRCRRRRLSCLLHDYDVKVRKLKFGGGHEHEDRTTALIFFSSTSLQSLRIHFRKKSPTFDDMNQKEKAR